MKKITFFLVSSLITTHYCHAQRALKEEHMAPYLPKKTTKFELANQLFELKDTSVISPNAVYVQEMGTTKTTCNFIRFFKDGKALVSFDYLSYPTEEQFNDFSYCRPAYYTIKDDEVIIEIYNGKQWGVIKMTARRLDNGGLEFGLANKSKTVFYRKDHTKLYKWL